MKSENTPYNPGMSEEAWKKLHSLISKLNIKYASAFENEKEDKSA